MAIFGKTLLDMPLDENSTEASTSSARLEYDTRLSYGYIKDDNYLVIVGGPSRTDTFTNFIGHEQYDPSPIIPLNPMPSAHINGASILMKNTDFWILGGTDADANFIRTTHYLRNGIWRQGPALQHKMSGMCAVSMFDDSVAVIGGGLSTGKYHSHNACGHL